MSDTPRVKIHLIGAHLIGERQPVTTRGVFKTLLDDERCERCAASLQRLEDAKWSVRPDPETAPGQLGGNPKRNL